MTSSTVVGIDLMELADKLTAAQQRVLLDADYQPIMVVGGWRVHPRNCRAALEAYQLIARGSRAWTTRQPSKPLWVLTALGLAVRDTLRARASLIGEERS